MPHQQQVVVGGSVQVAVEQVGPRSRIGQAHAREAGGRDLAGVVVERGVGLAADVGAAAGEQVCEAHQRRRRAALQEAHRPHPQSDDATGAGVGGRSLRRRGPGQQESPRPGASVNRPPHEIPRRRVPLPFVDEDGRLAPHKPAGVGFGERHGLGIVQIVDGAGAPQSGRGLAHSPWPLKTHSRQPTEETIELIVHDSRLVGLVHNLIRYYFSAYNTTTSQTYRLLILSSLYYGLTFGCCRQSSPRQVV